MQETIELTIKIITFSFFMFAFCSAIGLMIFSTTKDRGTLIKRYKLLMPIYYMFYAMGGFLGVIILTFNYFNISSTNIIIFCAFVSILVTSIKSYRLSKIVTLHARFKSFTCKKYVSDIVLCLLVFVTTKYLG